MDLKKSTQRIDRLIPLEWQINQCKAVVPYKEVSKPDTWHAIKSLRPDLHFCSAFAEIGRVITYNLGRISPDGTDADALFYDGLSSERHHYENFFFGDGIGKQIALKNFCT